MRDLFLTAIVVGLLPLALRRPYVALLLWSWLGYMNPHRLTWGFAFHFPFAQLVAITMLISLALNQREFKLPPSAIYPFWFALMLWMGVSTIFALYPDSAFIQYEKIFKIQLVVFLTVIIVRTREQLYGLIWVLTMSIAFFGVKGGIFTIRTAGSGRVWGPPGGYLEENNALAVGLLMVLPMMFFLSKSLKQAWQRRAMYAGMALCMFSVIGSQSRGAFVSCLAAAAFLAVKSRAKIPTAILMMVFAVMIVTFMPQSWHERMGTIRNYEQDMSAMGRINAWGYSFNVANDRLTGAGMESWTKEAFSKWGPDPDHVAAAHSIYFAMLADHGWPGLVLWAIIGWLAWRLSARIRRKARGDPELAWAEDFARLSQISFVAYCSGGAFLSLAYFDLPWHLMALLIVVERLVDVHEPAARPRARLSPRSGPVRAASACPTRAARAAEARSRTRLASSNLRAVNGAGTILLRARAAPAVHDPARLARAGPPVCALAETGLSGRRPKHQVAHGACSSPAAVVRGLRGRAAPAAPAAPAATVGRAVLADSRNRPSSGRLNGYACAAPVVLPRLMR